MTDCSLRAFQRISGFRQQSVYNFSNVSQKAVWNLRVDEAVDPPVITTSLPATTAFIVQIA